MHVTHKLLMSVSQAILCLLFFRGHLSLASSHSNFQVVHFLDPGEPETIYYSSWNSDQWIQWLRGKYEKEAEQRRQVQDTQTGPLRVQGSWVNIVIIASRDDFKVSYAPDSEHSYTDSQRSDYFWSDYAFTVYVLIRSPNATVNITQDEATNAEELETRQRTTYGYNVYNCAEKKMFVNAKIDPETEEPLHFQTFFPKKVKNPKDKLRIPLSVCSKVSQKRGLLDEIRFQLGNTIL